MRLQLGGALMVAVFGPFLIRYMLERSAADHASLQYSLAGTILALIAGYAGFRRVSHYPGARVAHHLLPSFSISYGIVLAIFFLLRIDYSRVQFIASYVLCLGWYYSVYFKLRHQRLRIGVVPFGDIGALWDIDRVAWVALEQPEKGKDDFDAIVADLRADIPDEWERFLTDRVLQGVLVLHVKQVRESLTGQVEIEHLSENDFGSLIPGIVYGKVKRIGDFVTALVALPILFPMLLIVGMIIKLDSPGPILFRQQRMGYRGRAFTMFKLRTMADGRGEEDARAAAMTRDGDHRVTRIGRFLRQYRVDEVPQILNILRGDMSWIGPRPEAVALSEWYEAELPYYRYRHIVRPGITGWAQVRQGHVAEVDEVLGKLHYDFYYIRNFSFWLDVLIVAATIRTIVNGFGAR